MKRTLTQSLLLGVASVTSASQIAGDPVLWYTFDQVAGRTVEDRSGHGNHGTVHGGKLLKLGDGAALDLDGVDDYVNCPLSSSLDMREGVTVEVWVRPAGYPSREVGIVAEWPVFALRQGQESGAYLWYAPVSDGLARSAGFPAEQWHHVVGTYDRGKMALLVDGELVHTATSKHTTLWTRRIKELWVGKCTGFFKGRIAEVRVYARALTPFEVGKRHDRTRDVYLAELPTPKTYPQPKGDLAAHYAFDEGRGSVVRDVSGNENHGEVHGATFVRVGSGHALSFDGKDDYVDCGNGPALDLRETVSLEAWVYPASLPSDHPGIVGKGIGSYTIAHYVRGDCYFYISSGNQCAAATLIAGTWQHIVGTFDGRNLRFYVNGRPAGTRTLAAKTAIRRGKNFFIGSRAPWDGSRGHSFHGIIDEVRVYNRPLSEQEVRKHYEATRTAYGLSIIPIAYQFRGDIVSVLDYRGLGQARPGTTATVALVRAGQEQAAMRKTIAIAPGTEMAEVTLEAADLKPGEYSVRGAIASASGEIVTALPAKVEWPGSAGAKILNNVVSELLNAAIPASPAEEANPFTNPRDGWVFFTFRPGAGEPERVALTLESADRTDEVALSRGKGRWEAMRHLPAGQYHVGIAGGRLIVRAIPEIIYSYHPTTPSVRPYGPYDEVFMRKHIFPNVNCVVSRIYGDIRGDRRQLKRWKQAGKLWLAGRFDVLKIGGREFSAKGVLDYLLEDGEYDDPLLDGTIGSEFFSGDDPKLRVWSQAVRQLHARFPGKKFYPWCGAFYSDRYGREFVQALRETGNKYAYERYLREQPTREQARLFLDTALTQTMIKWRGIPGAERNLVICLGNFMTAPHETLNVNPQVDYKVFMDMQYNIIANHPAFRDLGGVMEYTAILGDKEYIRWAGKLWRHYCIEGRSDMLSARHGFTYALRHIRNADFDQGTDEWTLAPAEPDSMVVKHLAGFGYMQGRYPKTLGEGDHFMWTRRCANRPNALSQELKGLRAGKLYSVKMFTGDYGDFSAGLSAKKRLAVSIDIQGGDILPSESLQHAHYMVWKYHPPFTRDKCPWINFHVCVFRAKANEGRLVLSDWPTETSPAGPIGQELMFGFIEVAPYLEG